ncbi:phytochrome-like protein cph2 [mine drainage metagenome]|uniref:Phytochrome-like protein cph2 n=1 Tax=mine drainage metagenome TaxID=410659 RepID=A0A1J5PG18_9ZZZZ
MVARVGGDEFMVLLQYIGDSATSAAFQAEAVSKKIHSLLGQYYDLNGHKHHSTASIGIAMFGDLQENAEIPMKRAELAMYEAKTAGRNTLRMYHPDMQAAVRARTSLEDDLREAVLHNEFILYYQPQVGDQNQLTGVEALVRWKHPRRGMVSPAEFIPLAEETGLILPLGSWVLESACTQLASWAGHSAMSGLSMAVNVSVRQFFESDFVDQVLAVLERTGANPHRLKLELTEGMLVSNIEDVITTMTTLKARGIGFSLDDFGTGYSSLAYLKRLPLQQLKIDQGFVRNILTDQNDAAIARMVIALAQSMGLAVIAEGVETLQQRDLLASLGCHAYQGYLFGKPQPIEAFEVYARRT